MILGTQPNWFRNFWTSTPFAIDFTSSSHLNKNYKKTGTWANHGRRGPHGRPRGPGRVRWKRPSRAARPAARQQTGQVAHGAAAQGAAAGRPSARSGPARLHEAGPGGRPTGQARSVATGRPRRTDGAAISETTPTLLPIQS